MENVNGTCSVDFPLELLRTFVVEWMHYVLLGLQLDSTTLAHFVAHFANKDYVRSRVQLSSSSPGPFPNATGRINPEASAGRAYTEAELLQVYLSHSPVLRDYTPTDGSPLTKPAFAELLFGIVAIAATLGGVCTLGAVLSYEVNASLKRSRAAEGVHFGRSGRFVVARGTASKDDKECDLLVLEAARRFCPVNMINMELPQAEDVTMGGTKWTLPRGTIIAANIMSASLDPTGPFGGPHRPLAYWPERPGLAQRTLNFNRIGIGVPEGPDGQTPLLADEQKPPVQASDEQADEDGVGEESWLAGLQPPKALPPSARSVALAAAEQLFWTLDTDLNGTLDVTETRKALSACGAAEQLPHLTTTATGRVSERQWMAAWRALVADKGGAFASELLKGMRDAAVRPPASTTRGCPGRFLALHMCRDVLRAIDGQLASAPVEKLFSEKSNLSVSSISSDCSVQ